MGSKAPSLELVPRERCKLDSRFHVDLGEVEGLGLLGLTMLGGFGSHERLCAPSLACPGRGLLASSAGSPPKAHAPWARIREVRKSPCLTSSSMPKVSKSEELEPYQTKALRNRDAQKPRIPQPWHLVLGPAPIYRRVPVGSLQLEPCPSFALLPGPNEAGNALNHRLQE